MFCCRPRFNTAQVQLREIPTAAESVGWKKAYGHIVSEFWGWFGFATSYATVTRVIRPWGSVALWQSLKVVLTRTHKASHNDKTDFADNGPLGSKPAKKWNDRVCQRSPDHFQANRSSPAVTLACHSSFSLHESFLLLHHPQRMAAGGIGVYRECLETSVHSVRLLWLVASGLISTLEPSSRLYPLCGACRARGIIYAGFWFCS